MRQRDRKHRARAVRPVRRHDAAVHRLDKAARDGEAEAGACLDLIGLLRAIELVEDVLEIARGNAVALIDDLQMDGLPVAPASDRHGGSYWRVFCRVIEQIE